jgi:hypothetical protein
MWRGNKYFFDIELIINCYWKCQLFHKHHQRSKKILLKSEDLVWSDEEKDINDKYIIKQNISSNKAYDSDEETGSTYMNEDKDRYNSSMDIVDSLLMDREGRLFDHNRSIFSGSVKVDKYIKSSKLN